MSALVACGILTLICFDFSRAVRSSSNWGVVAGSRADRARQEDEYVYMVRTFGMMHVEDICTMDIVCPPLLHVAAAVVVAPVVGCWVSGEQGACIGGEEERPEEHAA